MKQLLAITRALGDPNRIRILTALASRGELCVCRLHELLDLAPSTTSKHLSLLSMAGLVDSRKEGRWVYYRAAGANAPKAVKDAIKWLTRCTEDEPQIQSDSALLDEICSFTPEELCERQSRGIKCCSCSPKSRGARS